MKTKEDFLKMNGLHHEHLKAYKERILFCMEEWADEILKNSTEKNSFVNVYKHEEGRFFSDNEYYSYEESYESRDDLPNYIETVELIRKI